MERKRRQLFIIFWESAIWNWINRKRQVYYFENGQELSGAGKELLKEMAYNLVVAYEKAGDYQSAKEKLDSYLKANPDDKKALKEQEFLNTQISEGDQQ